MIVVPACHFHGPCYLCATTLVRLETALSVARETGDAILVTGDVPYAPGGSTLGMLMRDRLLSSKFPFEKITVLKGGVSTFSEARLVCEGLKGKESKLIVVSSDWYLLPGKSIWERRARENNLEISFVSVKHTGGWRTKCLYTGLGALVRMAIALKFEPALEERLTTAHQKRRQGFTFDGCR